MQESMNALNVDTGGRGGPRTKHKDNSHPLTKIALRKWIINKIGVKNLKILDVYGGYGVMYNTLYSKISISYEATKGDALDWLRNRIALDHTIFDVDPYSSPYEALIEISKRYQSNRLGICCTDGCLRRQCHMRGNIPTTLQALCGWPGRDHTLMASIYYNYPAYLRGILHKIFPLMQIESLVVKYGIGFGKASTVYFAAILKVKH